MTPSVTLEFIVTSYTGIYVSQMYTCLFLIQITSTENAYFVLKLKRVAAYTLIPFMNCLGLMYIPNKNMRSAKPRECYVKRCNRCILRIKPTRNLKRNWMNVLRCSQIVDLVNAKLFRKRRF